MYKIGRTNANDGGIDFVLKPVGRFFQVTEVGKYSKYFLDIDKVMKFPLTFVVKTQKSKTEVYDEMIAFLKEKYGSDKTMVENYSHSIEEIITVSELNNYIEQFTECDMDEIVNEIVLYFNLEMNIEEDDEEEDEE